MAWFDFLGSLRAIASQKPNFGSEDLARQSGLSEKDASAWISKFVRWGYAKRIGLEENPGRKPRGVYSLTDYGLSVEPKKMNRLSRLVDAVESYEKARGSAKEAVAFTQLIKTCRDVKNTSKKKPKSVD
jgi:DNA-binding PadR family transcriptional regulator